MSNRFARQRERQVAACLANPTLPMFSPQNGIDYCARCGWPKSLHKPPAATAPASSTKAGAA